jgi:hypothetical protein
MPAPYSEFSRIPVGSAVWPDGTDPALLETEFGPFPAEFGEFSDGLPSNADGYPVFPHPNEPDSLPPGWVVQFSAPYLVGGREPGMCDVFLIERVVGGGWGVVFHTVRDTEHREGQTVLWDYHAAVFQELYDDALEESRAGRRWAETLLRGYLLTCYDMDDPTEEAEATLVGLGGHITVFPSCLTPSSPEQTEQT